MLECVKYMPVFESGINIKYSVAESQLENGAYLDHEALGHFVVSDEKVTTWGYDFWRSCIFEQLDQSLDKMKALGNPLIERVALENVASLIYFMPAVGSENILRYYGGTKVSNCEKDTRTGEWLIFADMTFGELEYKYPLVYLGRLKMEAGKKW